MEYHQLSVHYHQKENLLNNNLCSDKFILNFILPVLTIGFRWMKIQMDNLQKELKVLPLQTISGFSIILILRNVKLLKLINLHLRLSPYTFAIFKLILRSY